MWMLTSLANLSQWLLGSDLGTPSGKTLLLRVGVAHFVRVIYAFLVSIQPWMAMMACEKFYKVDSLAVATRISHISIRCCWMMVIELQFHRGILNFSSANRGHFSNVNILLTSVAIWSKSCPLDY